MHFKPCINSYATTSARVMETRYRIELWTESGEGFASFKFRVNENETVANINIEQDRGNVFYAVVRQRETEMEVNNPSSTSNKLSFILSDLRPGIYTIFIASTGCPCSGLFSVWIS